MWAFVNYTVCQTYQKTTIPSVNAYRLSTITVVNLSHTICQPYPYHLSTIPSVNHIVSPCIPYNIYIYCTILHILSSSSHKLKHQNLHFNLLNHGDKFGFPLLEMYLFVFSSSPLARTHATLLLSDTTSTNLTPKFRPKYKIQEQYINLYFQERAPLWIT